MCKNESLLALKHINHDKADTITQTRATIIQLGYKKTPYLKVSATQH